MLGAFKDIVTMLKDFIMSIINGLSILITSLASVKQLTDLAAAWMPSLVFTVMIVGVALIVVLRVIGR